MGQETAQQTPEADPRLKKLRRIEDLADSVIARYRQTGSFSRIADAVKELLAEIKRPVSDRKGNATGTRYKPRLPVGGLTKEKTDADQRREKRNG
jgi:hypothetical protein